MPAKRTTQVQIKVSVEEKALYERTAEEYNITLAALARLAMEYVANNKPPLHIHPAPHGHSKHETHNNNNVHYQPAAEQHKKMNQ